MKLLNQIGFSIYSDIWAICYEAKQDKDIRFEIQIKPI